MSPFIMLSTPDGAAVLVNLALVRHAQAWKQGTELTFSPEESGDSLLVRESLVSIWELAGSAQDVRPIAARPRL